MMLSVFSCVLITLTVVPRKTPKTLADRGTVIAEVTSDLAVVTQTDEVVVLFVWPVATGPGELVFLCP